MGISGLVGKTQFEGRSEVCCSIAQVVVLFLQFCQSKRFFLQRWIIQNLYRLIRSSCGQNCTFFGGVYHQLLIFVWALSLIVQIWTVTDAFVGKVFSRRKKESRKSPAPGK